MYLNIQISKYNCFFHIFLESNSKHSHKGNKEKELTEEEKKEQVVLTNFESLKIEFIFIIKSKRHN